jgi:hypothetical protein
MRCLSNRSPIAMPLLWLLVFSVFITILSGCVFFPIQLSDEKPFKDEQLSFIEIGTTTKKQVLDAMSNFTVYTDEGEMVVNLSPQRFDERNLWVFSKKTETTIWAMVYGPIDDGYAYDRQFLLIKFDDNDIVSKYEVSSMDEGCHPLGVCWQDNNFYDLYWKNYYMLLASEEQDDWAKTFQPPNDGCSVYMYAQKEAESVFSPNHFTPLEIFVDDNPPIFLIDWEGFLHWRMDEGLHQLNVKYLTWPNSRYYGALGTSEIDCRRGDILFFEYQAKMIKGMGKYSNDLVLIFEPVVESEGRQEINKRRLVDME